MLMVVSARAFDCACELTTAKSAGWLTFPIGTVFKQEKTNEKYDHRREDIRSIVVAIIEAAEYIHKLTV